MSKYLREEKGSVTVILLVLVLVFFAGMSVLVTQQGAVYLTKSRMQNAVDAAALAGAQALAKSEDWQVAAENIATANGLNITDDNVQVIRGGLWYGNYTSIQVAASRSMPYQLSQLLGGDAGSHDVPATATAQVQTITGLNGLVPIVALPGEISFGSDPILLKGGSGEKFASTGPSGFRGLLSLDEKHGGNLGDIFLNGCKQTITANTEDSTSYIDTENGNISAIADKVNQRIASNPLVMVPVVETQMIDGVETVIVNDEQVHVIGFAAFMLDCVYGKGKEARLQGHFIEMLTFGDSSPSAQSYGLNTVKLIN